MGALGAAALRAFGLRSGDKRLARYSAILSILTFMVLTLALLLLVHYFLSSDFTYFYVWSYSSSGLPALYKLSGVWAGASGSFLLWVWFMALALAVEVMLEPRRTVLGAKFRGILQTVVAGTIFVFMVILLSMNLFERTLPQLLHFYPDGSGLNLSLQTIEMAVHPPVVFAGYAMCVIVLGAAVAYFFSGDQNWFTVSLPWGRLAWIFLTLGIGIGAIWAYYVLGWGGYWAWDPVETSSLFPWIMVTAFLHTQIRHVRKAEYGTMSPLLGMMSFIAVLFAAFATRAGSIWTYSVHSFPGGVGETASGRLTYLLGHDGAVLGIFSLMLALFAAAIYLAYLKYSSMPVREEEPVPERASEYIGDKNNMTLTVLLLLVTGAVMLLILLKNVDVSQTANYDEFNQKMSIFFVALMVTMSICLVWKPLGRERTLWLAIAVIGLSVVLAAAAFVTGFTSALVAFSMPSYAVAVGLSIFKLSRSRVVGSMRKTLQRAGPQIVHVGIALILLSFVVSSNLQSAASGGTSTAYGTVVGLGTSIEAGEYTLTLVSLSSQSTGSGTVVNEATVNIAKGGSDVKQGVVLSDLYGMNLQTGSFGVMDVEVYVYKSFLNDLYMSFQWRDNASAYLDVKVIPFMNFLWTGLGLLVIGLALRTVAWQSEPKAKVPAKSLKDEPRPPSPAGIDKSYEALVEEELRKFKERKSGS